MKWDVFISHASEDKESVAEPLAQALTGSNLLVWYDQFQLRLGDRLLRSINDGLRESRFGIVVLSPWFFKKHWPQLELDGLAQREEEGQKVILPIWKDVTLQDVRRSSPLLADRIAVKWSDGLPVVVEAVLSVVRASGPTESAIEDLVVGAVLRIRQNTRYLWQELANNGGGSAGFTARIRGDTLKTVEKDLAALREHAGMEYEVRHVSYDTHLGIDVNEIAVRHGTPRLGEAVAKVVALHRYPEGRPPQ
jgi:hypothetical protein